MKVKATHPAARVRARINRSVRAVPAVRRTPILVAVVGMAFWFALSPAWALDPNLPPGGNFDLSTWTLQLPINANGELSGASYQIPTDDLTSAAYTNAGSDSYCGGQVTNYFYTGSDGAMTFWSPDQGATTPSTSHTRSELSQLGSTWFLRGTHTLNVQCAVLQTSSSKVCIGQIKGFSPNVTCVMLFYYTNGLLEAFVHTNADNTGSVYYNHGTVGLSNTIHYTLQAVDGLVTVGMNGITNSVNLLQTDPGYATNSLYFKAGDYNQSTNGGPGMGARVAFYSLDVFNGPNITNQPASRAVNQGDNATFTVGASGNGTRQYQWWFNATNSLAGKTSASLTVSNVSSANVGDYTVVVSDSYGSVTSSVARLTTNAAPEITSQPNNQIVWPGDTATFTVGVFGNEPLSYQWFFNATHAIGSNTNSLTLTNVQPANAGGYSVLVTNPYGAVTSLVATLTFNVATTNVYATAGSTTWTCPAGVTSVQVECWGGGGAGGSAWRTSTNGGSSVQYGGGGAGGAYARATIPVAPGTNYTVTVGAGGANSSTNNDTTVAGGDSSFSLATTTNCLARGGAGGQSAIGNTSATAFGTGGTGTTNGSVGDVVHAGGSGGTQTTSANGYGGGGGGSGGTNSAGRDGSSVNGAGATAVPGGGPGGNANAIQGSSGPGQSPTLPPGGGGGGARASDPMRAGGTGAVGQVVLIYTIGSSPPSNVTATAAMPTGNGSGSGGLTAYAQRTRMTLTETPGGTGPFTYAWKKVGSEAVLGTNSTLTISPLVHGDQYTCDVAATWDGVTNTSPTATLTVTTVINPAKVAIIKADDFRVPNQAWTNFLQTSRDLGVKVGWGVIVSNIIGNAATAAWMQGQEAVGDVEFWNHGWDHTQWTVGGQTVSEFEGSGLAFMQQHLADAQAGLSNALGHDAVAFGTPYNGFDADTATVINATPALRLLFTRDITLAESLLNPSVAVVDIIGESDGTGMPNAATFMATYPGGPPGPVSLQFHPANSNFASRLGEYSQIVRFLLTNGYAILLPSEYAASLAPAAGFAASPTNGGALLTVTFTDTSTGPITNRFWSFGDGTTTNTMVTSPLHTYSFPGSHTVTLIVSGASGSSTNAQTNLIVAASVDTVGDGVPDWWRAHYFGGDGATTNASSCATFDYDSDGLDNLGEYLADTVPTSAASRLALTGLTIVANDVHLLWIGGSNAWQLVESSSNLADANGWSAISTNTPPTSVTNTLEHNGAAGGACRFYRIRTWR